MKYDRSQHRRRKNIVNGIYDDTHFEIGEYESVATRIKVEENRLRSIYKLTCDYVGTTIGSSEKMLNEFAWNKGLHTFLQTASFPIYHIDFDESWDMEYRGSKEGRVPYLDSVDVHIWTVIEGNPRLFVYRVTSYSHTPNKPIYTRSYDSIESPSEQYYGDDDKEILYSIRKKLM